MGAVPVVCFVGNCQAQAMTSIAQHLQFDIRAVPLPPVYDIEAFRTSENERAIREADFVFGQRVSEDYAIDFVRPSELKNAFGSKSLIWPNIYFDGYFPEIGYIYTNTGKMTGPLSEYHFSSIRREWEKGRTVGDVTRDFLAGNIEGMHPHPVEHSLDMLRSRETGLDIKVSDYVANRFRSRKMFYSMNHPDNPTLLEVMSRLFSTAGIDIDYSNTDALESFPYTLNAVDIPCLPFIRERYRMLFDQPEGVLGNVVRIDADYIGETREPLLYDWAGVIKSYFEVYDASIAAGG